jgi:uncharacterized protein
MENHPVVENRMELGAEFPQATEATALGPGLGILTWFMSLVFLLVAQFAALAVYLVKTGALPAPGQLDWLLAMLSVGSVFPAHVLTLLFCWLVVTRGGRRPFWQTLGWGWHPQFKWVHATALAFLMLGVGLLLEKLLPHQETDLEKLLKLGQGVRVLTALMAVLSAPLVEEIVYRGVLYGGVAAKWGRAAGVAVATLLFALVHVLQYRQSWAVLATILLLSLVLTLVRAATGSVLPGIATHFIFNGIQAVALLLGADKALQQKATETALLLWTNCWAVF